MATAGATAIASSSIMDHLNPGLLDLALTINNKQLTLDQNAQAKRKLERRVPELDREVADRPTRLAVQNYVGLFFFRLGQKNKAIECWEQTFDEDTNNLNAMQDLCTGYTCLGDGNRLGELRRELKRVQTRLSQNPEEKRIVYARCRAEQAYASLWDLHTGDSWDGEERKTKNVELYKSAIKVAENNLSTEERAEWCHGTARAFKHLSDVYLNVHKIERYLECLEETIKYLDIALTSDNRFCLMEAWCTMGNVFTECPKVDPKSIPLLVQTKYMAEWEEPALCYENALSYDEGNTWVLACYGKLHSSHGRHEEAVKLLDESIQNSKVVYWNAHQFSAHANINLAEQTCDEDRKKEYLKKAAESNETALKHNPYPFTFLLSAEIHYRLSNCAKTEEERKRKFRKALAQYFEAFQLQNGHCISDIHFKYGKCLLDCDRSSAIERFMQAFSTSPDEKFRHDIAKNYLLENMFLEYKAQGHALTLEIFATWVMCASTKLSNVFAIVARFATEGKFQNEVLDIMEYIVDKLCHLEGAHSILDIGFQELQQVTYSDSNSQRLRSLQAKYRKRKDVPEFPPVPRCRPQQARHPVFKYDFYVLNAEESASWVKNTLCAKMESEPFSFKGYLLEDTTLGSLEIQSQVQPMEDSAHVLIVLSPSFSSSCALLLGLSCKRKDPEQMAVLLRDDTSVPKVMSSLKTLDFREPLSSVVWFDLQKFLLRKTPGIK